VVTSGHVTKMAVKSRNHRYQKPHDTRKPHGSIFNRTGVTSE